MSVGVCSAFGIGTKFGLFGWRRHESCDQRTRRNSHAAARRLELAEGKVRVGNRDDERLDRSKSITLSLTIIAALKVGLRLLLVRLREEREGRKFADYRARRRPRDN